MRTVADLQQLFCEKKYLEALLLVEELLSRIPDCPYLLVSRAVLIMLQEDSTGPPLSEAEKDLLRAYELSPKDLDTLEELAHLYDVVIPDRAKAKQFARLYVERVQEVLAEMHAILEE
jgi:hypothetical protein